MEESVEKIVIYIFSFVRIHCWCWISVSGEQYYTRYYVECTSCRSPDHTHTAVRPTNHTREALFDWPMTDEVSISTSQFEFFELWEVMTHFSSKTMQMQTCWLRSPAASACLKDLLLCFLSCCFTAGSLEASAAFLFPHFYCKHTPVKYTQRVWRDETFSEYQSRSDSVAFYSSCELLTCQRCSSSDILWFHTVGLSHARWHHV